MDDSGRLTALRLGSPTNFVYAPGGLVLADVGREADTNRVVNPGFEDGASRWEFHGAPGAAAGLQTEVVRGGSRAARLRVEPVVDGRPHRGTAWLDQAIPVEPATRYLVSLWVRRKDCGVCGAHAIQLNESGANIAGNPVTGIVIPTGDDVWLYLSQCCLPSFP